MADEPRKSGLRSWVRRVYVIGFAAWAVIVALGIAAILYEPDPEPRGSLSLGSADAPVTLLEFADFQ